MDLTEMVGKLYVDADTGKAEKVLEVTSSSVLVTRSKLSEKGIDCVNWFSINDFNKKFILPVITTTSNINHD